jgi:oligopeptide/dipeptide ABC transporter ATP-binding protein
MNLAVAATPLVTIKGLSIRFGTDEGPATVDDVSLAIARGEIVALVGESGSGKSLIAHTIAGILSPAARVSAAGLAFGGVDLLAPGGRGWRELRGREIGVVFQNPRAALNPALTIGRQVGDVIGEHRGLNGARLREAVTGALAAVHIPEPQLRAGAYPGELSGGMCQRVMIAIALAGNPSLLIADEPTTGLDVTTQAAILDLILEHVSARRMAMLFITHELALARAYAERIVVLHAGQVVEEAPTAALFAEPHHPYSAALIGASPADAQTVGDLKEIAGALPRLAPGLPACRFAERCERVLPRCRSERPPLAFAATRRAAACWAPL